MGSLIFGKRAEIEILKPCQGFFRLTLKHHTVNIPTGQGRNIIEIQSRCSAFHDTADLLDGCALIQRPGAASALSAYIVEDPPR